MEVSRAFEQIAERVAATFAGDDQQRNAAIWEQCADVVDTLEELVPYPPPDLPPAMDRQTTNDLQEALNGTLIADGLSHIVASTFSQWRSDVQYAEAKSAGRLTVIVGALRRLFELERAAKHDETRAMVTAMIEHIEEHVRNRWRTAFPRDASVRDWPIRVTRRYDLLPAEWRALSPQEGRARVDRLRRDRAA